MADAAHIAVVAVRGADTAVEQATFMLFNDDAYRAFEEALNEPVRRRP
jgi:uncharacterized protein (DUF1778 family)